jgi:hypothetical protein
LRCLLTGVLLATTAELAESLLWEDDWVGDFFEMAVGDILEMAINEKICSLETQPCVLRHAEQFWTQKGEKSEQLAFDILKINCEVEEW